MTDIKMLEGSRAIAMAIVACRPGVVAAFPITPQTHIVEHLASFKAEGVLKCQFVRSESETAAASILLGAAAAGERAYTATSSQGLLHMLEVVYNIPGLGLPMVMTLANRAISAPINIWNDLSDAMSMRDAGWLMLFAESAQEAVDMHIIAFRMAEELNLPVVVNVDGFLITHATEPALIPPTALVTKFLRRKSINSQLSVANPKTVGHLVGPADYQAMRLALDAKSKESLLIINEIFAQYYGLIDTQNLSEYSAKTNNAYFEYFGPRNAENIVLAIGSIAGTLKSHLADYNRIVSRKTAIIRLKTYRPFPSAELKKALRGKKRLVVLDRAVAIGASAPLLSDVQACLYGGSIKISGVISGLGGKPIDRKIARKIFTLSTRGKSDHYHF